MPRLTRGELARRCGVHFETVRYYEQRGLIPRPLRSASNYRLYDEDAVRRLRLILRAKDLGFTLNEIKELLALRTRPEAGCADMRERAEAKIRRIDDKIRTLTAMRAALVRLTRACPNTGPLSRCPILEALDAEDESGNDTEDAPATAASPGIHPNPPAAVAAQDRTGPTDRKER